MSDININNALTQLKLSSTSNVSNAENQTAGAPVDFSQLLKQSIENVNELQQQSGKLGASFELGDPSVSLAEVMIAKQKAGIAFQSVVQVRNKLLTAYKEIMSMQV